MAKTELTFTISDSIEASAVGVYRICLPASPATRWNTSDNE